MPLPLVALAPLASLGAATGTAAGAAALGAGGLAATTGAAAAAPALASAGAGLGGLATGAMNAAGPVAQMGAAKVAGGVGPGIMQAASRAIPSTMGPGLASLSNTGFTPTLNAMGAPGVPGAPGGTPTLQTPGVSQGVFGNGPPSTPEPEAGGKLELLKKGLGQAGQGFESGYAGIKAPQLTPRGGTGFQPFQFNKSAYQFRRPGGAWG
jgi:hypothetical protein